MLFDQPKKIQLSKDFTATVGILMMHVSISHEIITYLPL